MGLSLKKGGLKLKIATKYIIFYSLLSPLGILIGNPIKKFT